MLGIGYLLAEYERKKRDEVKVEIKSPQDALFVGGGQKVRINFLISSGTTTNFLSNAIIVRKLDIELGIVLKRGKLKV